MKEPIKHFLTYQSYYLIFFVVSFFLINGTVLALTIIMEAQRINAELPFKWWEPFCWEYSSALCLVLLLPVVSALNAKKPLTWLKLKTRLPLYLFCSVVFSILHVTGMVAVRELIYWFNDMDYHFANDINSMLFELLYEYNKDIWTFVLCLLLINGVAFVLSRLRGEARFIADSEVESENDEALQQSLSIDYDEALNQGSDKKAKEIEHIPDRLLVRKLGKEFIIKVEEIEWMSASGNYVNLHLKQRIYPIRATLTNLSEGMASYAMCRIHRSHTVNLNFVDSIEPLTSGDSELSLSSGKKLTLSRRYKEQFKQGFARKAE